MQLFTLQTIQKFRKAARDALRLFGSMEGKGKEEKRKEKVRKRKKSGAKKVFPLVCLDTKRNRKERCEV